MNNDLIQDDSWRSMGEEWREATPGFLRSNDDVLAEIRKTTKRLFRWAIAAGSSALAVMASLTTLAICHRGFLTWTFAVIGWSLFLPVVAYLAFHRSDIVTDTLPTSSMLETLLRKQQAKKNLLEFLYTLLGIETIIASLYWLASEWHAGALAHAWPGFAAIFLTGTALTALFWWRTARAADGIKCVAHLGQTLNDQD